MTSDDRSEDGYALALEEARRALDEQERAVVELRARAGTLISAAAIVTSFLGARVLGSDHVGFAAWLAIAAFIALVVVTLAILVPRHGWEFSIRPDRIISTYLEPPDDTGFSLSMLRRDLAIYLGHSADQNRHQLEALQATFRLAGVGLAIEIVAWVAAMILGA